MRKRPVTKETCEYCARCKATKRSHGMDLCNACYNHWNKRFAESSKAGTEQFRELARNSEKNK